LPVIIKNGRSGRKKITINVKQIKHYLPLNADGISRLTKYFDIENYDILNNKINRISRLELAKEYQQLLLKGNFSNKADLARHLGVSRAWITKVFNELK